MSVTEAILYHTSHTRLGQVICVLAPKNLKRPMLRRLFIYLISKLHLLQFSFQEPKLTRYVLGSQLRRRIPLYHRWLIIRLFFQMASEYHFLSSQSSCKDTVLIVDEGFVHRASHMFVSESERLDPDGIREYVELLPRSDLVIWVKTPQDICLDRIYTRGLQVRLRNLTAQDIHQFVENAQQVVTIVRQFLNEMGWPVVEIANDGDLVSSTAELCQSVELYLPLTVSEVG